MWTEQDAWDHERRALKRRDPVKYDRVRLMLLKGSAHTDLADEENIPRGLIEYIARRDHRRREEARRAAAEERAHGN